MKLEDIVALAKQGYKPNDVKELIALSENTDNAGSGTPSPEQGRSDGATGEDLPKTQPGDDAKEQKPTDAGSDDSAIDYKALYEESQRNNKKLNDDLIKAQQANITQTVASGNKQSDQDILADIARSFM